MLRKRFFIFYRQFFNPGHGCEGGMAEKVRKPPIKRFSIIVLHQDIYNLHPLPQLILLHPDQVHIPFLRSRILLYDHFHF